VSLTDYPHFQAWIDRMIERPAWRKVMDENERAFAQLRG
jgi:glutathione S-transferase